MDGLVSRVVVIGGGTAGWLAASLIAARADPAAAVPLIVTLVESPDIPAIGVGEGTWPTMRATLQSIGVSEAEFLLACDASFKQGSRFDGWRTGAAGDSYLHPFTPPPSVPALDLVRGWQAQGRNLNFASAVSAQARVCGLALAPRQRAMPDYAGALNYAYHLDAAKFAAFLSGHATGKLGVRHIRDHVVAVDRAEGGDILAVRTAASGPVAGDLFIDCTGHAALLVGDALGVPFIDRSDVLFNDRALAAQLPVAPHSPVAAQTNATAHAAGWIWDIGLPTRRGIGCVYSSRHLTDDAAAATLTGYLKDTQLAGAGDLPFRRLTFRSGHRERFWERNCVAVGLSAGFLEPLEASAIVLVELSVGALLDGFPRTRAAMDLHAARFNTLFRYRWDRIVEFLKLHYVLSQRDEPYWRDHRDAGTVPTRLCELLRIWRDQPPSRTDLLQADEIFPAASYQYVLYGMGFATPAQGPLRVEAPDADAALRAVEQRGRTLAASLPSNRTYLDALRAASPALREQIS
ncbi:tryptophan halogenase family protein [Sphingomonas xinjiangensis]|uniref:Tryptophan halogenase n=1 Tax=Sphingomonas xinjiangensis TaxID=643568 RepID=A0A840YJ96_9SPHN|nr:tryptophan halogenase family protein [Sphingomonas xinjiangensis]MBB5711028.1 hypothetical protein [Sphingomonas xinjiangensis]